MNEQTIILHNANAAGTQSAVGVVTFVAYNCGLQSGTGFGVMCIDGQDYAVEMKVTRLVPAGREYAL